MLSNSDHEEHLLALDSSDVPQPWRRTKKITLVALALGSTGFVGLLDGLRHSAPGKTLRDSNNLRIEEGNTTELATVSYTPSCYGYTGGTCVSSDCNADRDATCDTGKCVCNDGCTGADGTCTSNGYTDVSADPFTLTNAYWDSYQLYFPKISAMSPVSVSNMASFSFFGSQMFKLYELPGRMEGKKQYFLSSNKWTSWVAAVGKTPPYGVYAYNLDNRNLPWDPQGVVVNVCDMTPHGQDGAVKIGSIGSTNHWFYMQHTSWNLAASSLSDDPGSTGYWKASTALTGLEPC